MISLTPLIKLLAVKPADFNGVWFRKVDGAAAFAQIRLDALPLPAAWVVRYSDNVKNVGERIDDMKPVFDIVIGIENARSHTPGEIDDVLIKYRKAVYKLLTGLEIDPDMEPIKYGGGKVIEYTDGDLYWSDRYSFNGLITNYLPDPEPVFSGINHMEANANDHYL